MGIWKEIKHALNSTLGTDKFEPLDKMITTGRTLVPSDDLLKQVFTGNEPIYWTGDVYLGFYSKDIIINLTGQLKINLTFENIVPDAVICEVTSPSGNKQAFRVSSNDMTLTFSVFETGKYHINITSDKQNAGTSYLRGIQLLGTTIGDIIHVMP